MTGEVKCKHPGCDMPKGKALGYCNAHYIRYTRGKDMDPPVRKYGATESERFWPKVDKTGGCWIWTGAKYNGYGVFRYEGAARLAHRISYAWVNGPIPGGIEIDHMCHNRACVNADHLRPATKILNGQNRSGLNKNNTSGVRGVHWSNDAGCWVAKAHKDGRPVHVGRFDDLEEAATAIKAWRRENMPYSIHDRKEEAS